VDGIKEQILAAIALDIRTIIIPKGNMNGLKSLLSKYVLVSILCIKWKYKSQIFDYGII